jgi:hypothetical protein
MRDRCGLKINISLASSCRFCYWITRRSQKKEMSHTLTRWSIADVWCHWHPFFSCSCGAIRITKVENFFFFFFLKSILHKKKKIEGKTHMTNHVSLSWRKKHFLGRCWAIDSSCWMIWIDMYPMEWKRKRSLLFISPLFCIYCCTMGLPRAPVDRLQLISSSFCVYKYICDCCCRPCGNLSILLYT